MLQRCLDWAVQVLSHLRRFTLLPSPPRVQDGTRAQLSALRVVLISGLLVEVVIGLHSAWVGIREGQYYVVWIVAFFYAALVAAIRWSDHHPRHSAVGLIITIYAAGLAITLFIRVPEIAHLGYLFCYTAPLLAGLLHSRRLAVGLMVLNLLPFWGAFTGYHPPSPLGNDTTLPEAALYIHTLLFTFFNLCMPLAAFRIVSSLQASQRRLAQANELYEALFENHGAATVVCGSDGRIQRANGLFLSLIGVPSAQGQPLAQWLRPLSREATLGAPADLRPGSEWRVGPSSEARILRIGSRHESEGGQLMLALHDVTELRALQHDLLRSQAHAQHIASHDAVTGLPKREAFCRWLEAQRPRLAPGQTVPVVAFGLDALRLINARHGRLHGDRYILACMRALQKAAGGAAQVARVRGSVLALALPALAAAAAPGAVQAVRDALPADLPLAQGRTPLSMSVGVAFYPSDSDDAEQVVHRSELALDRARRARLDQAELLADEPHLHARRLAIESGLSRAIEGRELEVVYQPKVAAGGELQGFEALLRWHSPLLGSVSPAEFVPVAEQAGWVARLTDYVLEEVCRQLAVWHAEGAPVLPVAVNLSARDLDRDNLFETVLAVAGRHGIGAGSLSLEVTETFLAERPERAFEQLQRLRTWSFQVAIDDFGTGYSSLAKLADLPIDILKIDRSFLRDLPGDARRERIVRSIVMLAKSLELKVVAEGVELPEQLAFLQALGVDGYQGFLLHAPAPAAHWSELLRHHATHLAGWGPTRPGGSMPGLLPA
jgi:diguanylate cyclase